MDLALNNLQRLICHKTNQSVSLGIHMVYICLSPTLYLIYLTLYFAPMAPKKILSASVKSHAMMLNDKLTIIKQHWKHYVDCSIFWNELDNCIYVHDVNKQMECKY